MKRAVVAFAFVAGLAFAPSVRAQSGADAALAEQLFREARALMTAGRYAEACPKLAESQRIDPGVGTLINLGECYEKDGKIASAWASYTEAGPMARRLGQRDRARFAEARATALAASLSYVTLHVATSASAPVVTLDDKAIPAVAWGTSIPIDAGHHSVSATASDRKPWRRDFDVETSKPGTKIVIDIPPLEPIPPPKVEPEPKHEVAPKAEPARPSQAQPTLGWVSIGVGGAAAVTGGVFGFLAKSKYDETSAHCTEIDCDATGVDLTQQARGRATASTVFFAAGGALLAAGVVLLLTAPRSAPVRADLASMMRALGSW